VVLALLLYLLGLPSCPVDGYVTSEYGYRTDPITHRRKWHKGLDIGAPEGTPIRAMWDGRVKIVHRSHRGYGNNVVVQTGSRTVRFAHMHKVHVERGQEISKGDVIGLVGESGRATGPHLHLEIWERGRSTDPGLFLWQCRSLLVRGALGSGPPTTVGGDSAEPQSVESHPR